MLKRSIIYLGVSAVLGSSVAIAEYKGDITPQQAFEWASTADNVYILDVRTPQEWKWVGHPGPNGLADSKGKGLSFNSGAGLDKKVVNIAYWLADGQGNFLPPAPAWVPQIDFYSDVMSKFPDPDKNNYILLSLCKTGGRAEHAAQELGDTMGYTTYRIEHGFQGDPNDKTNPGPDTLYRDVNGWVNSKLPYNDNGAGAYVPGLPDPN